MGEWERCLRLSPPPLRRPCPGDRERDRDIVMRRLLPTGLCDLERDLLLGAGE